MKIISNFNDYYDGVQNYGGNDKSIIFKRLREEWHLSNADDFKFNDTVNNLLYRKLDYDYAKGGFVRLNFSIIGFAGKFYSVFQLIHFLNGKKTVFMTAYCYSDYVLMIKNYIRYIDGIKAVDQIGIFNMRDFFVYDNNNFEDRHDDIFLKYNIPIFSIGRIEQYKKDKKYLLTINPNLGEFEFYKMFDSFRTFQEIEVYINSVLVSEKSLPNIPQKYRFEEKRNK